MVLRIPDSQIRPSADVSLTSANQRDADPGVLGIFGARSLTRRGEVMQQLAEQEFRELEAQARVEMLKGIEQFDQDSFLRLNQMEQEDTGDGTFVKAAMDDLETRATEFVDSQPAFLREEADLRLMEVRGKTAKTAVVYAQNKYNARLERDIGDFNQLMVNKVRFGQTDEAAAVAKAQDFIEALPERFKPDAERVIKGDIRAAGLSRMAETDPDAALEAIEKGDYNDVDTRVLESVRGHILKSQVGVAEQQQKAEREAYRVVNEDPRKAAILLLQSRGEDRPTEDQIWSAQDELLLPKTEMGTRPVSLATAKAVLTKEEAEEVLRNFESVQNVDEFLALRAVMEQTADARSIDPDDIVKDLVRFTDISPVVDIALRINPVDAPFNMVESVVTLLRDPEAAKKARASISERLSSADTLLRSQINKEFAGYMEEIIAPREIVMRRSWVSVRDDIEPFREAVYDIGYVALDHFAGSSTSMKKALKKTANMLAGMDTRVVYRVDNNDGYFLPSDIADRLSEGAMRNLALHLIEGYEDKAGTAISRFFSLKSDERDVTVEPLPLYVPEQFPSEQLGREHYITQSGWTIDEGGQGVVLRANGNPVRWVSSNGQALPFSLTFTDLADIAKAEVPAQRAAEILRARE